MVVPPSVARFPCDDDRNCPLHGRHGSEVQLLLNALRAHPPSWELLRTHRWVVRHAFCSGNPTQALSVSLAMDSGASAARFSDEVLRGVSAAAGRRLSAVLQGSRVWQAFVFALARGNVSVYLPQQAAEAKRLECKDGEDSCPLHGRRHRSDTQCLLNALRGVPALWNRVKRDRGVLTRALCCCTPTVSSGGLASLQADTDDILQRLAKAMASTMGKPQRGRALQLARKVAQSSSKWLRFLDALLQDSVELAYPRLDTATPGPPPMSSGMLVQKEEAAILMDPSLTGRVIGVGGCHLRALEQKYSCKIQLLGEPATEETPRFRRQRPLITRVAILNCTAPSARAGPRSRTDTLDKLAGVKRDLLRMESVARQVTDRTIATRCAYARRRLCRFRASTVISEADEKELRCMKQFRSRRSQQRATGGRGQKSTRSKGEQARGQRGGIHSPHHMSRQRWRQSAAE